MKSQERSIAVATHQAMMKCPWQWRPAFLDERRESRKRKAGDGNLYDPVDPSFVDHLLPVYAKRYCFDVFVESEEKEKIEKEIVRLKAQQRLETRTESEFVESESRNNFALESECLAKTESVLCTAIRRLQNGLNRDVDIQALKANSGVSQENLELADSIMLMSKRAMSQHSILHSRFDLVSDDFEENYLVYSGAFDFTTDTLV